MTTPTLDGKNPGDYVLKVTPNDVLFGRGSGPNDHEGNITFRDLVAQRKQEYMATNHRQTKAKIAQSIVDKIFADNGRFLKKLEPEEAAALGYSTGQDVYQVVEDETVIEKAKQALRQNRNREDGASSPKSPANKAAVTATATASTFTSTGLADTMSSYPGGGIDNNPMFSPLSYDYGSRPTTTSTAAAVDHARTTGIARRTHHDYIAQSDDGPTNTDFGMHDQRQQSHHYHHQQQQQQQQDHHQHHYRQHQLEPSLYMDNDGYATYTTTLEDPDDANFGTGVGGRGGPPSAGGRGYVFNNTIMPSSSYGGPKRSSLLGGRKSDAAAAIGGIGGDRRDSIQLADVWRKEPVTGIGKAAESMHMSELMESFRGMSTSGDFNASTDTIGTIDNLTAIGGLSTAHMSGISNMSMMSIGSTTSLFRNVPDWTVDSLRNTGGTPPGVGTVSSNDDTKRDSSFGMNDSAYWGSGGGSGNEMAPRLSQGSYGIDERRTSIDIHSLMMQGSVRGPLDVSSSILRSPLEGSSTMSFDNSVRGPANNSSGSTPSRADPSVTGIGNSHQHEGYDINPSSLTSPLEGNAQQQYHQEHGYSPRIVPGKRDDERL